MVEQKERRILAVDDLQDNLDLIEDIFEDDSCTVLTALDAESAVAIALSEKPSLALLDVRMPDIDGYELCRMLRKHPSLERMPVLFLTAEQTSAKDAVHGLDLGATDYIAKPVEAEELRARVRAVLRVSTEHAEAESKLRQEANTLEGEIHTLEEAMQALETANTKNERLIADLDRRNGEIMQLTYAMTHDLQTPLASLTGTVDRLRVKLDETVQGGAEELLDRVDQSVDRMANMLDDLMAYAREGNEKVKRQNVDTEALLEDVIEEQNEVAASKGIRIECVRPIPPLEGDEKQLGRVFSNLISNAIKYTPAGTEGRVTLNASVEGQLVTLRIVDTGSGIEPGQIENVFLPFKRATSAESGSGLGLATVQRIVNRHGGRVWAESDGRSGTTVFVELPTTLPEIVETEMVIA